MSELEELREEIGKLREEVARLAAGTVVHHYHHQVMGQTLAAPSHPPYQPGLYPQTYTAMGVLTQ